uniref:PZP, alpha-2-macroglobulin like n=1 Tax=Jaculus jaculus TaxID=51337 RepID=A0A8C5L0E5_JACJA
MRGEQLSTPALLLLLLLLPGDASATAKPQYAVLMPSVIYAGAPEQVCVNLQRLNETVTLSVSLEDNAQHQSLLADLTVEKDAFHCRPFMIPQSPSSFSAFITVQVKGPTQLFVKRKSMHVVTAENLVFVQTDKPLYKPAQTVKFRIVSMDVNFHPLDETVCLLPNPSRNRIFQWQNLRLQGGLSQQSFPLSVEPSLGTYKVIVMKESGKKIEHSFEVKEYVLPKFEVQVKVPKTIAFVDEEFEVSACGLYTYGKPVPGLVTINVCRRYATFHSTCYGSHSQSICEEFSQQADNKGCFTQLIKTKVFQLRQRGYDMTIQVEAKVREEGTGLELTGYGSSEITNVLSTLKFTKVDSHYRRGIPFFGQVKPVPPYPAGILSVIKTDGLAGHEMLTTNMLFILRQVTYRQTTFCFTAWWLDEHHTQAQHSVNHIFSPSKSYVHLELVPGTLSCGQTQEMRAHYILNEEILKGEKELAFYSVVRTRVTYLVLIVYAPKFQGSYPLPVMSKDPGLIAPCPCKPDTQVVHASEAHLQWLETLVCPFCICLSTCLSSIGLNIFTNSKIHKPRFCQLPQPYPEVPMGYGARWVPVEFGVGAGGEGRGERETGSSETNFISVNLRETVRKHFPETWIWDLVALDSSGGTEVAVTVPDSITEWKASALCLSRATGFGLSPTISLQAFQPFFLELTLPYSVVRGEAFTLKATVFNYMSHCIRVRTVQLQDSPDFLAVPVEDDGDSHCVCGSGRKTVSWTVTPKSLGHVNFTASAEALRSPELCGNEVTEVPALVQRDTVTKPLLVEPEGIEKEETFNTLVCPPHNEVLSMWSLKVPPDVVEGSARATYSVLGDILGNAMQNLQNLVQMPYGCGEQNMVLFVPNIYVLKYLNETQQLTENIRSKAISYLVSGYQRQLNYKHSDGSYSTFGDHGANSQGNTWLTAFVLKAFGQAQSYIFVEKSHIMNALTWLSHKQKENGCFQQSGSLLNNAIKGGVDDEVTLSAYVTIALLEMPLPVTHSIVRNALFCLETAWGSISEAQGSHVYTKALLAYAFALAGNQAKRSEVLGSLSKEAVKGEASIHWQRPGNIQEAQTFYYEPRAPSAEVEMTAYVLLAYLTAQPAPSPEDLSVASNIVKWIIKQQNSHGGFASTQDTVVALQALSKYGAATFTKSEKEALVTIKSLGAFSQNFHVSANNRLLLHQVRLPDVPGDYVTMVSGSGCVYLQTSLRYNILATKEGKAPFTLHVDTLPKTCDGEAAQKQFQIHINVSYTGERPSSNMVIVDVKMVSGFIPVKPSVKKLQAQPDIQRTEVSTNHVLIYFEKLTKEILSFSFLVEQDILVKNLKPAPVKVYDYYEKDFFLFFLGSNEGNA